MAFLVIKVLWSIISVVSQCFRINKVGVGQVFDNIISKHMTALRKRIQSVANHCLDYCFWLHAIVREKEKELRIFRKQKDIRN